MATEKTIFTVGHSNHSIEYFLELLQSQNINCLIDVRSTPASAYNPQYNQLPLQNYLKRFGVTYLHFGAEFGARQEAEELLDMDGRVNFHLFQKTRPFQDGIERVEMGLEKGFRMALMCSEGNPLECHRFSMIAGYLENYGMQVLHILKDKQVKTHAALEAQLFKKYAKKLPQPSLFEPTIDEKAQLKALYELHNQEVGWQSKKHNEQQYD